MLKCDGQLFRKIQADHLSRVSTPSIFHSRALSFAVRYVISSIRLWERLNTSSEISLSFLFWSRFLMIKLSSSTLLRLFQVPKKTEIVSLSLRILTTLRALPASVVLTICIIWSWDEIGPAINNNYREVCNIFPRIFGIWTIILSKKRFSECRLSLKRVLSIRWSTDTSPVFFRPYDQRRRTISLILPMHFSEYNASKKTSFLWFLYFDVFVRLVRGSGYCRWLPFPASSVELSCSRFRIFGTIAFFVMDWVNSTNPD